MQVQAGWAKGLNLTAPRGEQTRPTSAKVRASIFDMLRFRSDFNSVLDLYCGSGAMGIESISQGANAVTFVDQAMPAMQALKRNLSQLERISKMQGYSYTATVHRLYVEKFLRDDRVERRYSLIFADPPYAEVKRVLPNLLSFAQAALASEGVFILESSTKDREDIGRISDSLTNVRCFKQKKYGDTLISLYECVGG